MTGNQEVIRTRQVRLSCLGILALVPLLLMAACGGEERRGPTDPVAAALLAEPDSGLAATPLRLSEFGQCPANCLEPWAPPDRWFDADEDGSFNPDPVTNPGEFYDPDLTGYTEPADVGLARTVCLSPSSNTSFGLHTYYAVDFPPLNKGIPVTGADQYRQWLEGCVDSSITVEPCDSLRLEPGNMTGPTAQAVSGLIALDPGAYWDQNAQQVAGSAFPVSPRIVRIPLFSPAAGVVCGGVGSRVRVAKIAAFFIESASVANLTLRFVGEECDWATSVPLSSGSY